MTGQFDPVKPIESLSKDELFSLITEVANNVRSQLLYQSMGLKKDSDHTVKHTWHARGGFDACKWILEQSPQLDHFTNLMNMDHPSPFQRDVERAEKMDKGRKWN